MPADPAQPLSVATFGGGCFWCTEAVFLELRGVKSVVSGYSGGEVDNPTYRQVCGGDTGHAEVIQVKYDSSQITFEQLLDVFFHTHDPTTLNRQGNDRGTQYRSVIFYSTPAQERIAKEYVAKLSASGEFRQPIVTEISPLKNFYPAEDYHQQYYALHGHEPYCRLVIAPKLAKFREHYEEQIGLG